jgi:hypothetical protein
MYKNIILLFIMAGARPSGKVLALVALLLALGGLSLQLYSMFIIQPDITTRKTWYAENPDSYNTDPIDSFILIPNLYVSIDLKAGESVYFLFICRAAVWENGGINYVQVNLAIDGIRIPDAVNQVQLNTGSGILINRVPLTFQYSTSSLAIGIHTITVLMIGGDTSNYVVYSTLLVQTYIS